MFTPRAVTLLLFIAAAAATRLLPHPMNFTAVGAMCLFGGAYFERRWQALAVPLAALIFSDLILAATDDSGFGFGLFRLSSIWVGYGLFALTALIGTTLAGRVSLARVAATAIAASLMFFLISNFCAWLEGHSSYPRTLDGLLQNYVAAIPFARNQILADLFYSGVLFGGYEAVRALLRHKTATVAQRAAQ